MTNLPDLSAFTDPDDDDDLVTLQDHANFIREKAELIEELESVKTDLKVTRLLRNTVDERVKALVNDLFDLEMSSVEDVLTKHKIELPRNKYAFTFKVTGTVTRTAFGLTEKDAWNNIDLDYIDGQDVDNIMFETRGGYEYAEEIDSKPFNFREFLGR